MQFARRNLMVASLVTLAVLVNTALGEAQTFRFRLDPLCDKITVSLLPSTSDSVLPFVGYDDNCGEAPFSPIYGTLVLSPDGSFSAGYTTSLPRSVYPDRGADVGLQTNVEWPANSNHGFWSDDDGKTGTFVFDILDQPSG